MKTFISCILILFICTSITLFSELRNEREINSFGVTFYGNFNQHKFDFAGYNDPNSCCANYWLNEKGFSFETGLFYKYCLTDFIYLRFDISYNYLPSTFKGLEKLPITNNDTIAYAKLDSYKSYNFGFLQISAMGGVWITDNFSALVGLSGGPLFGSKYTHNEKMIEPEYGTFENGKRERNVIDSKIEDAVGYNLNLRFGLTYDFYFNWRKSIAISPVLMYSLSFTDMLKNTDWKISQIQLGVNVHFKSKLFLSSPIQVEM